MNLFLKLENGNWKFERKDHELGGVQYIFSFDNGYQASIVKFYDLLLGGSYGYYEDLWELAVLKDGKLDYDNSVANGDVIGFLTDKEVNKLLKEVEKLKEG